MKELREWRGKRADAGRIAPKGFPKNNKFGSCRGERQGQGEGKAETANSQLATNSSEQSAFSSKRGCGVAEEQLFAGPAADAQHDQIVLAPLGLLAGWPRPPRCPPCTAVWILEIVAVGNRDDVLEDGFFVPRRLRLRERLPLGGPRGAT